MLWGVVLLAVRAGCACDFVGAAAGDRASRGFAVTFLGCWRIGKLNVGTCTAASVTGRSFAPNFQSSANGRKYEAMRLNRPMARIARPSGPLRSAPRLNPGNDGSAAARTPRIPSSPLPLGPHGREFGQT